MVPGAAALVVAGALAAAGVVKLVDRQRTAAGFERLGLPRPVAWSWAVPIVELAVALTLVTFPGWGGVVAFALLSGFTVYLAGLVRSGRAVPCACFGSAGDRAVSSVDLVRNGLLLGAAAAAATHDGRLGFDLSTVAVAAVAGAAGAVLLRELARRWGRGGTGR